MATSRGVATVPIGLRQIIQNSDIMLAFGVVAIVSMMIIPLPETLLDILITVNIAGALTILLVSLYITEPLQFSVFPSMLLITTLFRLALNISATKLILLHAHAGKVIESFGQFVVGGNYVVGIVVFLILIIIQFVVITNGAGRVAEVAARFTLDAMPGKQMSIDADLNAGLVTEAEARRRRKVIENEADFYGAMDGASKFVKGDAIAGVIIIIINILGGFVIGVTQLGIPLAEALQTYTILTIGDGLVTQIPAILISTATGIIVTRAASESNLGRDAARQILSNHRAILIVAALLFGLGIVPGLPQAPFLTMSAVFGGLGLVLRAGARAEVEPRPSETEATADTAGQPESFAKLLHIDPIELHTGYALIPLVDAEQGGNLLGRITLIRRQIALELGIVLPTIRIRDSIDLTPNRYIIKLRDVQVASGEVRPDRFLAMNPGAVSETIDGIQTTEPVFGLPATWITTANRERAEGLGYTVVDPSSVIATHLTEVVRRYAAAILGRQDMQNLLNEVKADNPAVVEGLVPDVLTLGEVHKVLRNLLRERVSVRDLVSILEALAFYARITTDTDILSEYVRQALGSSICNRLADSGGVLHVLTLSPRLQESLTNAVQHTDQGLALVIEPDLAQRILQSLSREMEAMARVGHQPILVLPGGIRLPFRRLTERSAPNLAVLSYSEIPPQCEVRAIGMVNIDGNAS